MGIIRDIKHNLQIGAPKLRPAQKNIEIHHGTDTIPVRIIIDGGQDGTHIREMRYRLYTLQRDIHGHEAYAVHTQDTHSNDNQGWNMKANKRLPITRMLDLHNPAYDGKPILIDVTAEIGRGVNNPHTQIELRIN